MLGSLHRAHLGQLPAAEFLYPPPWFAWLLIGVFLAIPTAGLLLPPLLRFWLADRYEGFMAWDLGRYGMSNPWLASTSFSACVRSARYRIRSFAADTFFENFQAPQK